MADSVLSEDDIKAHLPHRHPMLFVDRVVSHAGDTIVIESDAKPDAAFFAGHFPGNPIMPGVLIVETVAQAGALLISLNDELEPGQFMAFSAIDSARFKKPVYPNETIRVDLEIVKRRGPFYKFSAQASVGERAVATVEFSAAKMNVES